MARVIIAANTSWNLRNFRYGLIREISRAGHEVITVSPDPDGLEMDGANIAHRTWKMHRSSINPLKDLSSLQSIASIIKDERPDIFLSFTIKPNIYGSIACRMANVPAVPNVSGLGSAFLGGSILRGAVLPMYRFAFSRAKTVFFQNPHDQRLFVSERLVREDQCRTLAGSGIDLAYFSPSKLPREINFLMIARLLADKGVREFVDASRMLKKKLPSANFSLLGELDAGNRSAVQQKELDRWLDEEAITYLGSTSDVRPFIRKASAVVLPSYREGLPRTLLEGAAMGRPLIGTDVPGCRELVREGLTGILCKARNAQSLASAMEQFANTPYERRAEMGRNARTMAEREFDERFVVDAYLDEIANVAQ